MCVYVAQSPRIVTSREQSKQIKSIRINSQTNTHLFIRDSPTKINSKRHMFCNSVFLLRGLLLLPESLINKPAINFDFANYTMRIIDFNLLAIIVDKIK